MKKIEVGNDGIEREVEMTTAEKIETLAHDISGHVRHFVAKAFLKWYAGGYHSCHLETDRKHGRQAVIDIWKGDDRITTE